MYAAGFCESAGCFRANWNNETQSYEVALEFWGDNSSTLVNIAEITFAGIPSQPVTVQSPHPEGPRP